MTDDASREPHESSGHRIARIAWRLALAGVAALAWSAWIAWGIGRILTDRHGWSQWLHWIPTAAAAVLAAIAAGAWTIRRRSNRWPDRPGIGRPIRRAMLWGPLVLSAAWLGIHDLRLARRPVEPPATAIKVLQWTVGVGRGPHQAQIADAVVGHRPDLAVMTDASLVTLEPAVLDWLETEGRRPIRMRPFTVLTRFEIETARIQTRADGISIGLLVVLGDELPGGRLVVHLIDLPSDPSRPRHEIVAQARDYYAASDLPPADLLLGDFNMVRGGWGVESVAGDLRDAWAEGGHSFAATWPAEFPLWAIDHIRLGPRVRCIRYETPRRPGWRHVPQIAWIVAAE
ncbi:MAG: hypothetical protein AB8G96_04070 [Phycisphaerales bacterium]